MSLTNCLKLLFNKSANSRFRCNSLVIFISLESNNVKIVQTIRNITVRYQVGDLHYILGNQDVIDKSYLIAYFVMSNSGTVRT